ADVEQRGQIACDARGRRQFGEQFRTKIERVFAVQPDRGSGNQVSLVQLHDGRPFLLSFLDQEKRDNISESNLIAIRQGLFFYRHTIHKSTVVALEIDDREFRSEERRVGKEW